MSSDDDEGTGARAQELAAWLERTDGVHCARCAAELCAHERLFASALGHRASPVCSACAARELGHDADALRSHLRAHFERRSCFHGAWSWADDREPSCAARAIVPLASRATSSPGASTAPELADAWWDAGEMGCGDLVLELRGRVRAMKAGEVLEVLARDPGASEDLPAWCRLTGHELVLARAPRFLIRRKRD